MIENKIQYEVSKECIARFEEALAEMDREQVLLNIQRHAIESQLEVLNEEVEEYRRKND